MDPGDIDVRRLDPAGPEAADLVAALDAYRAAPYPPASLHLLPAAELAGPGAMFLGAFAGGRLVGCGRYVPRGGGCAELKRLSVRPEARGRGVAGRLLAALEARARRAGVRVLRLETGAAQPDSQRVCERAGFGRRGPFGGYPDDPLSVFMEKRLAPDPDSAPAGR